MSENSKISRRSMLKLFLQTGFAGFMAVVLYPVYRFLIPPEQSEVKVSSIKLEDAASFEKDSGKIIKFGSKPVIVLRTPEGEFRAFGATCTHLDCTVQYNKDMGVIWCACHNGKYDLNGINISGPPPRPLEQYNTLVQNNNLIIQKTS